MSPSARLGLPAGNVVETMAGIGSASDPAVGVVGEPTNTPDRPRATGEPATTSS